MMRIVLEVRSKALIGGRWYVGLGMHSGPGWLGSIELPIPDGETVRVGDRYEIALTPVVGNEEDQS